MSYRAGSQAWKRIWEQIQFQTIHLLLDTHLTCHSNGNHDRQDMSVRDSRVRNVGPQNGKEKKTGDEYELIKGCRISSPSSSPENLIWAFQFSSKCRTSHSHRFIFPTLILMMMVVVMMMMILCLQWCGSKRRALRDVTVLWEHRLRWRVVECLWCLELCDVERVCWSEYRGWIGGVRLSSRRKCMIVVLQGGWWHGRGWHERGREMRSVTRFVKSVCRDGRRGDQELLYHPFVLFHVGIKMQLCCCCHTLWSCSSIPVYETGCPSACHGSVASILESSRWSTSWSRAGATKERLCQLCL